jgi:hypothetical protein
MHLTLCPKRTAATPGMIVKIELKYLVTDTDRHGNVRYYVRLPRRQKVRILRAPKNLPTPITERSKMSLMSHATPKERSADRSGICASSTTRALRSLVTTPALNHGNVARSTASAPYTPTSLSR